jgi:phytoene dehydrogenase-like protein
VEKRDECDVVIIGSGIGGLTCAAALTKRGKKVLVIEQHRRPGGYVSSFKRKEFRFDSGLEAFSSNGIVFPILKELGLWNKVKFVRASFQIIAPNLNMKLTSLDQVRSDLEKAFPANEAELEGYFKELHRLVKPIKKMYQRPVPPVKRGFEKFITMFPMPFTNPGFFINGGGMEKAMTFPIFNSID